MNRSKIASLLQTGVWLSGLAALGVIQAQPAITGIYPDGTTLFQASDKLSFAAAAPAGITNISVQLNVRSMTGGTAIKVYTSTAGLTINGMNVSAPLMTDNLYTATIIATDGNGVSTTNTVSFDTISPAYTWEAEDWDFDNGQYIDNPQTNAYAGKKAVDDVDAHNPGGGGQAYRPVDGTTGNCGNEACGDTPRAQYKNSGQTDYDLGWTDNGDFANYTRTYPAGSYYIFMRGANPNASGSNSAELSGPVFGRFGVPNTGSWQVYTWVPLLDTSGNLVQWDSDGSVQTFKVATVGGNYNANFYMLLPVPPPPGASDAAIESVFPDGTYQFQPTNTFALTITSSLGVNAADIFVQLGETNLSEGTGSSTLLTTGSGLTVKGSADSLTVTAPLNTNRLYGAFIQITDANGVTTTTNIIFDTIIPAYTWEAEDWDYGDGQFFDTPQTNAYAGLAATANVDIYNPISNAGTAYRPSGTSGLGSEVCADKPRLQYLNTGYSDYDLGWTDGGSGLWGNYTRSYPAGKWNIFMRGAGWVAGATESAILLQGGGASGTRLGRFAVPNTATAANTYQNFVWVPLIDIAGNLVEWETDGSPQILTIQTIGGSWNANCFMLMPVNADYKPVPFVSDVYPSSAQMFAPTNRFTFTVNSTVGITAGNVVVTLNGVKPVGLTFTGTPRTLTGTCPVASNAVYTVVIELTDANGSSTYTTIFATVSADNYMFEGEDFDYDNGQFHDNPQVGEYAGLLAVDGVDAHNASGGNSDYRSNVGLGNEVCGDLAREQFTSAGKTDYDIGWTASGQWANYTRTYPAGVYHVLARGASPSGQANGATLAWVTSGVGTSSQTTAPLGIFNFPLTGGWQTWAWTPLVNSGGDPVEVTTTGEVSTFRLSEDNGGWNLNFFMLIPVNTARPVISQVYPDGSALFQRTDTLSFVATSPSGIDTNSVKVTLNGVVVPNLSFSGPATRLTVNCPVQLDTAYTAVIFLSSSDNLTSTMTYRFDTFSSNHYTFEAEDFDYNSGQFFDPPQTNAYVGLLAADGVDAHNASGGSAAYRPVNATTGNLGNEGCGDLPRAPYSNLDAPQSDYNIGWTASGQWANYTRSYPAGVYYIMARGSSPSGQAAGASLAWVTAGAGTSTQTITPLGKFDFPLTGGWQTYTWSPLTDSQGNWVKVNTTGNVSTLRLNQDTGGYNINFFMLVPAGSAGPTLQIIRTDSSHITVSWAPAGGTLEASSSITPSANWQPVGTDNPAVIPITGTARFFRVRNP